MSSVELHENNNIIVKFHSVLKKIFDEIDEVIQKYNESIAVDTNYFNATQDQRENSNVSLVVAPYTDDVVVLCQADGIVKNKKVENENSYCVTDLPSQETTINDLSDDEPSPKKSKQFTFNESDLPDSEEIKEYLKPYPRPQVTRPLWIESESESNSEDDDNRLSWRLRKKTKPVTKIEIDKLPTKFMTRQRVPNIHLVCKKNCLRLFQSIYLGRQEDQIDEDIIRENINQLKTYNKSKGELDVRIVKPERKDIKSNLFAQKNTKKNTLDFIPAPRTTTRRIRCLKNKTDGKNNMKRSIPHNKGKKHKNKINVKIEKPERKDTKSTPLAQKDNKKSILDSRSVAKTNTRKTRAMKNITDGRNTKSVSSGNVKKDDKLKLTHMKRRSTLPAVEERRSKRYQKTKEKEGEMMKAPVSVPKKSMHEQSTIYNISSSSSESLKRLRRSLVEDIEGPSPKRTRPQNNNVTNVSTPARVMKTRHQDERVKYTLAQKRVRSPKRLNSNTKFLHSKKRSHFALRRRSRRTPRTSTKRLKH